MPTAPLMILLCSQNKLCGARMRPLTAAGREVGLATLVMVAGGLVSRTGGKGEARKDLTVQWPVAEERGQKVRQAGNRLLSRNCMENHGRTGTLATISGMRGHQVRQRLGKHVARMVVGEEEVAEEARRGERLGVVCNALLGRTQTVSICLLSRTCLSGFYSECVGHVLSHNLQ